MASKRADSMSSYSQGIVPVNFWPTKFCQLLCWAKKTNDAMRVIWEKHGGTKRTVNKFAHTQLGMYCLSTKNANQIHRVIKNNSSMPGMLFSDTVVSLKIRQSKFMLWIAKTNFWVKVENILMYNYFWWNWRSSVHRKADFYSTRPLSSHRQHVHDGIGAFWQNWNTGGNVISTRKFLEMVFWSLKEIIIYWRN